MMIVITGFSIFISCRLYAVFIEIKNASIRNKTIFIEEFKEKGYLNHQYTKENYSLIKKWAESRYPQMDYIKSQDLLYASTIFRNSKNSKEYKRALKGKEDISKIYKEIEFDTLRECFKEIIKIEEFIDSDFKIKEDAFQHNNKLFKSMSNDSFFSNKLTKSMIFLSISLFITIICFIFTIIPFLKFKFI